LYKFLMLHAEQYLAFANICQLASAKLFIAPANSILVPCQ
jgi:hypothetical protein